MRPICFYTTWRFFAVKLFPTRTHTHTHTLVACKVLVSETTRMRFQLLLVMWYFHNDLSKLASAHEMEFNFNVSLRHAVFHALPGSLPNIHWILIILYMLVLWFGSCFVFSVHFKLFFTWSAWWCSISRFIALSLRNQCLGKFAG